MDAKQMEYQRKMASQRRREREAAEAAAEERGRAKQQALWARRDKDRERERSWQARAKAARDAERPVAKCCGKPLLLRDNGIDYCEQCWEARSKER